MGKASLLNFIRPCIEQITRDVAFEDETKQYFVMQRLLNLTLCTYILIFFVVVQCSGISNAWLLVLMWLPLFLGSLYSTYRCRQRIVFHLFSGVTILWIISFVVLFGWDFGVQHFIFPLLVVSFFATYNNLRGKAVYTVLLFSLRIALFFYTKAYAPVIRLPKNLNSGIQILNSIFLFLCLFTICWLFSQTNQAAQEKLSAYNARLRADAATDALTSLPNRRSMYDLLSTLTKDPTHATYFTVAIGDIDFFKNINDSLGHNCGDQVLRSISAYFKDYMMEKGLVCRWGGEEFLFLFPDMNGDVASFHIQNIHSHISAMEIPYKEELIHITMTFGVEEYDFSSNANELIKKADDKLYHGKQTGRNCVIY